MIYNIPWARKQIHFYDSKIFKMDLYQGFAFYMFFLIQFKARIIFSFKIGRTRTPFPFCFKLRPWHLYKLTFFYILGRWNSPMTSSFSWEYGMGYFSASSLTLQEYHKLIGYLAVSSVSLALTNTSKSQDPLS